MKDNRISIYIPEDLRLKINALEVQPNWSAIAYVAFNAVIENKSLEEEISKLTEKVDKLTLALARIKIISEELL